MIFRALFAAILSSTVAIPTLDPIPLWPDGAPGAKGKAETDIPDADRISSAG